MAESESAAAEVVGPPKGALQDRRGADRIQRIHYVRIRGQHDAYRGMVVNLSRTGALVTITDEAYQAKPQNDDLGLIGLRIAAHFGAGMWIEFPEFEFNFEAEVVRLSEGEIGNDFVSYMGVRFPQELSDTECAALGVRATAEMPTPVAATGVAMEGVEGSGPLVVVQASPEDLARARKRRKQAPARVRITDQGPPLSMHDLLTMTVEKRASDLHFKGGSPVRMRVDGALFNVGDRILPSGDAEALVRELLTPEQQERFDEDSDLDMAYSLEGQARFRVNVLRSKGEIGMAIRRIPEEVPSPEQLGLAPICMALAERPRGLVLVTGPTGSGKSTTLAAMIHHVNATRACHILTMEDPIEYNHREVKAHMTQREIGRDTKSFAAALRRALRQDPDVILVGEMRDLETIALAVTSAETGHLVFGTLHTTSAVLTVDRIVDVFPPEQQRQIRMQLADSLQAIISQVLLPRIRGGVAVAQEILVANGAVRALIREGKAPQISNAMQTGAKDGMQTLEDSLNALLAQGSISYETAVGKANVPTLIKKTGR